jgi:AGCS family alanine or glycine:cation symporter
MYSLSRLATMSTSSGAVASADLPPAEAVADLAMGLMATTNLFAILLMAPIAVSVLKDYERQRRQGIEEPLFDPAILKNPELVDEDVWPVREAKEADR